MALVTIVAQIALMHIFVAVIAVVEFQTGEYLKGLPVAGCFFMAGGAIGFLMLPFKREISTAVVKFISGSKGYRSMALCTFRSG